MRAAEAGQEICFDLFRKEFTAFGKKVFRQLFRQADFGIVWI